MVIVLGLTTITKPRTISTTKAHAMTFDNVEVLPPTFIVNPNTTEVSHKLLETFIVDRDFENDQNFYRVFGTKNVDAGSASLKVITNVIITYPQANFISKLRTRFSISMAEDTVSACYGYRILVGPDRQEFFKDDCLDDEDTEAPYFFELDEENTNIWPDINQKTDRLEVEITGKGEDDDGSILNSTSVDIKIYEILPSETTTPRIMYDSGGLTSKFMVQDSGSGLSEISTNCKFKKISAISVPLGSEFMLDFNIPAFTPGTTDPVIITWIRANEPSPNKGYRCGIWAKDSDGNTRFCEYRAATGTDNCD
jgi:hypothetical protein